MPTPNHLDGSLVVPILAWLPKLDCQMVVVFVVYPNLTYKFIQLDDDSWRNFHQSKKGGLYGIDRTREVIYWRFLEKPPDRSRLPSYEVVVRTTYFRNQKSYKAYKESVK